VSVAALTDFGRMLREAGVPADPRRIGRFCDAASRVDGSDLYWVGQATLVSRPDQLPIYDRVFRAFFGGVQPERPTSDRRLRVSGAPANADDGNEALLPREAPEAALASSHESIRVRSFSRMTRQELDEVARLMARLQLGAPTRRSRRRRATRKGEADMRRTLRLALRTGGEPIQFAYRARRERRRRLVLMLDISGSMGAFSRALLVFGHAALAADQHWEVFSFGTRLTRLTAVLRGANVDQALANAAHAAVDWDGGTRIGDALRGLLDDRRGGTVRGAVVVICSDGLDVGEPSLVGIQMARLHRLAHRVVWVNPLRENPEYAPLARGMAAALPHVDHFASGHNFAELESLAEVIAGL
jgi:uncharacterized protein